MAKSFRALAKPYGFWRKSKPFRNLEMMKNNFKIKLVILSLALAVHLAMFFYLFSVEGSAFSNPLAFQPKDSEAYTHVAVNLVKHGIFSVSTSEPYLPDPARTPIFSLFLAIGYAITGDFFLSLLMNVVIGSLIALVVFEIVLSLFRHRKIALISAVIFTFLPYGIYSSTRPMADTLFTFFFSLFILAFIKIFSEDKAGNFQKIILSALLLGLATLTRPVTQYFVVIPFLFLLFDFRLNLKRRVVSSLIFFFIFAAVLSPWLIRNYVHFNRFFLSSVGKYHLLVSYAEPWLAYKDKIPRNEIHKRMAAYIEEKYGPDAMHNIDFSEILGREALNKILQAPLSYAAFHLSSMPVFFLNNDFLLILRQAFKIFPPDFFLAEKILTGDFKGIINSLTNLNLPFALIFLGSYGFMFLKSVFGAIGAVFWLRQRFFLTIFLLSSVLYFALIVGLEGQARFRLPVEPILVIFAAVGIYATHKFLKEKYYARRSL